MIFFSKKRFGKKYSHFVLHCCSFFVWLQYLSRVCWKSGFNSRLHQTRDGKTISDRSLSNRCVSEKSTQTDVLCHSGCGTPENYLCFMVMGGLIDCLIDWIVFNWQYFRYGTAGHGWQLQVKHCALRLQWWLFSKFEKLRVRKKQTESTSWFAEKCDFTRFHCSQFVYFRKHSGYCMNARKNWWTLVQASSCYSYLFVVSV